MKNELKQWELSNDKEFNVIQGNLLQMGFDLIIVNKVLVNYPINSTEDAIVYLTKSDGLWNHTFIPISEHNQDMISSEIITSTLSKLISNTRLTASNELCEICNESILHHRVIEENKIVKRQSKEIDLELDKASLSSPNNQSTSINNLCLICLSEYDNPITLPVCSHSFCKECLIGFISERIINNNVENIPCPKAECDNRKLQEEFFLTKISLSDQMILKYHAFKRKNAIAQDLYKVFCPSCNSYSIINTLSNEKTILICLNGHSFCSCGRTDHEGSCYKEGKEYTAFILHEKIKKCPKCGFLINKNKGCNHMKCGNPQCQFEFCWLCMRESLPDHYSFGQCEGMQFIDDNSLLYKVSSSPSVFKLIRTSLSVIKCIFIFFSMVFFFLLPIFFISIGTFFCFVINPNGLGQIKIKCCSVRFIGFLYWLTITFITIAYIPVYYFWLIVTTIIFASALCFTFIKFLWRRIMVVYLKIKERGKNVDRQGIMRGIDKNEEENSDNDGNSEENIDIVHD